MEFEARCATGAPRCEAWFILKVFQRALPSGLPVKGFHPLTIPLRRVVEEVRGTVRDRRTAL